MKFKLSLLLGALVLLTSSAQPLLADPLDERVTSLEKEVALLKSMINQPEADAVAPYRTEYYTTSNQCDEIKATDRGLATNYPVVILKRIVCGEKTFAVVKTLPAEIDRVFGAVHTVLESDLISTK